jgi:hypothetical protein
VHHGGYSPPHHDASRSSDSDYFQGHPACSTAPACGQAGLKKGGKVIARGPVSPCPWPREEKDQKHV